jgi:hypothetical protein
VLDDAIDELARVVDGGAEALAPRRDVVLENLGERLAVGPLLDGTRQHVRVVGHGLFDPRDLGRDAGPASRAQRLERDTELGVVARVPRAAR